MNFYGKIRGMKKNGIILIVLFSTCFITVHAQDGSNDYNNNGDESMKNLDYVTAKNFYELGVFSNCDPYSIDRITHIWDIDSTLRANMNAVMAKCYSCLEEYAKNNNDTSSIKLLIKYSAEGIGTSQNKTLVDYWEQKLEAIRKPPQNNVPQTVTKPPREKVKMQFFAGYSATYYAPFGLTVGGIGKTVGWYLRFRSNFSFQDYSEEWDGSDNISGITGNWNNALPRRLDDNITNMLTGTGGIVIKAIPSFYISVGAGYCSQEVLYKFEKIGVIDTNPQGTFWAKYNGDTSFQGVALDLDGILRIGGRFYGSLGCSVFDFKYISANAGIGVFF